MPLAQNGAATGTYVKTNGGTAEIFSTNNYTYQVGDDGYQTSMIFLSGDGGTDGAGAVDHQVVLPYTTTLTYDVTVAPVNLTSISDQFTAFAQAVGSANYFFMKYQTNVFYTVSVVSNSLFGNGGRTLSTQIRTKVY